MSKRRSRGGLQRQERSQSPAQPSGSASLEVSSASFFVGPLPAPEDLIRYNDAFPDCAERIVASAERQAEHRQSLESKHLDRSQKTEARGQWFAFLLFLAIISGGIFLLWSGKDVAGYVSLVTGIVSPIALFVASKRHTEANLMRKWQQLMQRER